MGFVLGNRAPPLIPWCESRVPLDCGTGRQTPPQGLVPSGCGTAPCPLLLTNHQDDLWRPVEVASVLSKAP